MSNCARVRSSANGPRSVPTTPASRLALRSCPGRARRLLTAAYVSPMPPGCIQTKPPPRARGGCPIEPCASVALGGPLAHNRPTSVLATLSLYAIRTRQRGGSAVDERNPGAVRPRGRTTPSFNEMSGAQRCTQRVCVALKLLRQRRLEADYGTCCSDVGCEDSHSFRHKVGSRGDQCWCDR